MLHCYVQMIKYWHHIKTTTPKDSLVYNIINYAEQSETQKHCRWLSTVKFILKLCNLNYVWEDPTKIKHGALITKCFNHLVKRYCKFWHDHVNNVSCCPSKKQTRGRNKLRTYKLIKNDYKMETYLYHISDCEVRRDLTKLRCSNVSVNSNWVHHPPGQPPGISSKILPGGSGFDF